MQIMSEFLPYGACYYLLAYLFGYERFSAKPLLLLFRVANLCAIRYLYYSLNTWGKKRKDLLFCLVLLRVLVRYHLTDVSGLTVKQNSMQHSESMLGVATTCRTTKEKEGNRGWGEKGKGEERRETC
jgi:hypothetical protein